MKITSFYPLIATKHEGEMKEIFQALGFEIAHIKSDFDVIPSENSIMKDELGHRVEFADLVDLFGTDKDTLMIRVNVDDLDGFVQLLTEKGFRTVVRDDTASAKYCMMVSPYGLTIDLCEHLK